MPALCVFILGLLAVSGAFCSPTNGSSVARPQKGGSAVSEESKCLSGWSFSEGANRCYKVNNDLITWEKAQAHCETFNATLAIILNRETEEALRNYTYANINEDFFHIGLRYVQKPKWIKWTWLDGTKPNYTNWYTAPNEPNPVFGLCAQASLEQDGGRWYPEPCWDDKHPSVCELPALGAEESLPESGENSGVGGQQPDAGQHVSGDGQPGAGQQPSGANSECKDAVSQWKCTSLKAIQACKAAQYFKYMQKNCAKTCGFCQ
ncbi:C-type lectin 7 [Aphelenchoides avenae]|nr:C-type lectin 7 [Aphelenchus avenae]